METERVIIRREPVEEKVCPSCGKTFTGLKRATYCSPTCVSRAYYHRHREARQAARRARYAREKGQGTDRG